MPCHPHVQCVPVSYLPLFVSCLLTFATTLDAAALNRTRQEPSKILPADQLQPVAEKDVHKVLKVDQVNDLLLSVSWRLVIVVHY